MEGDLDVSDECTAISKCGKCHESLTISGHWESTRFPGQKYCSETCLRLAKEFDDAMSAHLRNQPHCPTCPTCHGTGRVDAEPYTAQVNCQECDKDEWDSHKDEIKDKIDRWYRDDLIRELNNMAYDAAQIAKELEDSDGSTTEGDKP